MFCGDFFNAIIWILLPSLSPDVVNPDLQPPLVHLCRAAELMTRTGSVVTLEVAKQGAIYHGLATLLNQPSPMMQRGKKKKHTHKFTHLLRQTVLRVFR